MFVRFGVHIENIHPSYTLCTTLFNTLIVIHHPNLSFILHDRLLSLRLGISIVELDAHRVHTVPLIRGCWVSLALEYMSQVTSAVAANDLCPLHAESAVSVSGHGARHGVEEGRPSAAGLELVLGSVDGRIAAGAGICAGGRGVLVVFAGEGCFSAFLTEDAELLCRSGISPVHSTKHSLVIDTADLPLFNCICHS
jgi:hypothetical protein